MTIQNIAYSKPKTKEDIEIRVGSSNNVVDGIRNVLSIPTKILLLNMNMNSGNVSKETIEKMRDYLHENGLYNVDVSVNEYNPVKVWRRIFSNPNTSALSKCTVGIANGLLETISISKLTGIPGDHYNPSSNSVHLFSNDSSVALHECGHAKDFNSRKYPTLYALAGGIPLIGPAVILHQELLATRNAIKYLREKRDVEGIKEAWKTLAPAYSTYIAYAGSRYFTISSPLTWLLTILGLGHLVGRFMAATEKEETPVPEKSLEPKPLEKIVIEVPPPTASAAPAA